MKGLYISKNDGFISETRHESGILRLLAKDDRVDIMLIKIESTAPMWVSPDEGKNLLEFFYVVEGTVTITVDNEKSILEKGEYFYVDRIEGHVPVTSEDKAVMLYVATQPVYNNLQDYIDDMNQLLKSLEIKDHYTHSHSKRVTDLSLKISNKLGLSNELVESLGISAIFHDIGKFHIADDILNKPSKLTDDEWIFIKQHPIESQLMLKDKFGDRIADIVSQHHERLDGTGYPNGLKGEEIILEAKIIAVADSYDAMTTNRVYRKGISSRKAIEELKSLGGIKYDAGVVTAFEQVLKDDGLL